MGFQKILRIFIRIGIWVLRALLGVLKRVRLDSTCEIGIGSVTPARGRVTSFVLTPTNDELIALCHRVHFPLIWLIALSSGPLRLGIIQDHQPSRPFC